MALTTVGRGWIIDRLQNVELPAGALMQFIGWGTGSVAENVADTDLGTASSEARTTGTLSQPTATTDRCVGTITSTQTQTITEAGRFNTLTKGAANQQMQQRHVFTGIPLLSGDAIVFTLDLTD
ncbi:hypothetical protein NBH00_05255 [Paraconexibacter antarcticus]|uniref:Uncharacterized protein n=1 Tax=Paraconexibacter antarcticus TaxID=2949664 RepID=A0ABY5DUB7_9ACTN|nr:hypothetical protein [Paraconexibacter antarcticus]UTI65618.1 hypothetical protein NBH00_05255 [Paraconexibacter antarcticus]